MKNQSRRNIKIESAGVQKNLGETLKRLRKLAKVSQTELGGVLAIHQTAVCRVEQGTQSLLPEQLYRVSQFFGIELDALISGRINFWRVAERFEVLPPYPERYRLKPCSKLRDLLPLIFFSNEVRGPAFTRKLLAQMEMDSMLFADPDQSIGVNLKLDLARELLQQGVLNQANFIQLINHTRDMTAHGALHAIYETQNAPLQLIQARIANAHYYESNFAYRIEAIKSDSLELSIKPEEHMQSVDYKGGVLSDFLCRYKRGYLENFPKYIGGSPLEVVERECHFKHNSASCVYLMRVA
jgi:transcriptional regulator with XRE-family HTH domain